MKTVAITIHLLVVVVASADCHAQTNQPVPVRPRVAYTPQPPRELLSDVYAKLIGKTVLVAQTTPNAVPEGLDLQDTNKAIQLIEAEFAKRGFVPVRDGAKFVRLLPEVWDKGGSNSLQAMYLKIVGPVPASDTSKSNQAYAAGDIRFPAMDFDTFLAFYSKLSGRIVLCPGALPQPTIHLISQTSWTRAEAIYAFEMTMALNSIAVVHDGDHFVQVVSANELAKVQTNAPPYRPEEPRESLGIPARQKLDLWLTYYAKGKGKTYEVSNTLGSTLIPSSLTCEMTRSEVLYAIETILRLNGFAIVPINDTTISVAKVPAK